MRIVFGLVLVLGVALAGFAVYMAQDRIGQYESALEQANSREQVELVKVFTTKRALQYGEPLTKDDVFWVPYPKKSIPEGAYYEPEEIFPEPYDEPRLVTRRMEEKEIILAVKVTEPGEDAGVATRLSKGMRAFAINVNVSTGVSGFLRPGDRVDVYWSGNSDIGEVTKLIEAGVSLIAVDQVADADRNNPTIARTVTVEASPQQVASLAQAQATGRLSLALVGAWDDTIAEAVEVDQDMLLGIVREEPKEVQREERKRTCTIKTRKGSDVVEIPIPCPTN